MREMAIDRLWGTFSYFRSREAYEQEAYFCGWDEDDDQPAAPRAPWFVGGNPER
jgi:hypothetical protein